MKRLLLILALLCSPAWAAWGTGTTATCEATSETAASTLACTLGGENADAGNVLFHTCAGDNTATTSGNSNTHSAVTDSGSNTWTKAYEWTVSAGAAADGATISLHFSKLTTGLTSGSSTITCNYGSSITDRAVHLIDEFTIGAGNVVSIAGSPTGANVSNGDAGSLTVGSLTSGEYLWVRAIAAESNAVLSMTATTNFALPNAPSDGCNGTTGGGEATDMAACSEWDVLTGTTNTSDPTLVDTTNDNASVFVAFQEAAPPAGLPRRNPIQWR